MITKIIAGRSTINGIHTLQQIYQKALEYNRETHTVFVDFKSAFDMVTKEKIMKELKNLVKK